MGCRHTIFHLEVNIDVVISNTHNEINPQMGV